MHITYKVNTTLMQKVLIVFVARESFRHTTCTIGIKTTFKPNKKKTYSISMQCDQIMLYERLDFIIFQMYDFYVYSSVPI